MGLKLTLIICDKKKLFTRQQLFSVLCSLTFLCSVQNFQILYQKTLYIQCPLWKSVKGRKTFLLFCVWPTQFPAQEVLLSLPVALPRGLVCMWASVPVLGVMYRPVDPALSLRQTHSRDPISVSFPELHDHWYECCLRVRALILFLIPPLRGSECKATRVTAQVELLSAHTCNRWDQE